MNEWIESLCTELHCSEAFSAQLDRQLATELIIRTAVDPVNADFWMAPVSMPGAKLWFDDASTGHILTNLVGPDAHGWWVELAWRCDAHPNERIEPSAPVGPGCELRFYWSALEDQAIHDTYAQPAGPPWPKRQNKTIGYDPGRYNFAIEWWTLAWPFAFVEIASSESLTDQHVADITGTVDAVRGDWNTDDDNGGVIHTVHSPVRLDGSRCAIFIDFGSASMSAVVRLLDALQELTGEIPIAKVTFRPSSN